MGRVLESLKLRDPTWQAIGTIVGVIALLISTAVAYDIYRKSIQASNLIVKELFQFDPLQFSETMRGRIALLIDGKAAESVIVSYYLIANTGTNPILPNDYVEPIQISVQDPWEILAVETEDTSPAGVKVTWAKIATNTFQMAPTLLNPTDNVGVLLFLTNPAETEELPELEWTSRIVNLRFLDVQRRQTAAEESGLGIFFTGISHYGWSVYWLAGLAIILFTIGVLLAVRSHRLTQLSALQMILLTVIMALSFSSSEILVDYFIEKGNQWWGAWFLLGLHLIVYVYLIWPLLKNKINLKSSSPP